jgi:carboxylesterase
MKAPADDRRARHTSSGAHVPVLPNAEPFDAPGGPTGVLLLHGFTGSPYSMLPWARHLAAEGFAVSVPRLPGHGTTWQEMNRTEWTDWFAEASHGFDKLRESCDEVFVFGLSMGGCLSLRLAEERPDEVAGLVLVNPIITTTSKLIVAVPVLKRVVGSVPGVVNDIKKPGQVEYGYDRMPLRALDSMRAMWKATRDDLPKVTVPLVVFRSVEDHVVEPISTQIITQRVSSRDVTERVLDNSYHVATLDFDADSIFTESVEFIRKQSTLGSDV